MARGIIGIDTTVAVGIFLIMVALAFAIYINLFTPGRGTLREEADLAAGKVFDFVSVESHDVPIAYQSAGPQSNAVLFFNYTWPFGMNSTNITSSSGSPLQCMLRGSSSAYFKADLASGQNTFTMRYSNLLAVPGCNATLNTIGAKRAIPLSIQVKSRFSDYRINQLFTMQYSQAQKALGINRDFRVEIDGGLRTYGLLPPPNSDVFVRTRAGELAEDIYDTLNITVLVW
ncbi:MAG: hypothetical protein HY367_03605 [Candidatus Aenigmarchaeota archaeon]|nr:hypothetical protein [Candidatus Aenigmarchaeota archaeon]